MNAEQLQVYLADHDMCPEARKWAAGKTLEQAWSKCERGDWLIYFALRVGVEQRLGVRAACRFARLVLQCVPDGEDCPRLAIETAEAWCDGDATLEEVKLAADAVDAAAYAASAAYAAEAAVDAAYAAYAAASAAADAAADAAYAAEAAEAADAAAARADVLRQCADIVREVISFEAVVKEVGG